MSESKPTPAVPDRTLYDQPDGARAEEKHADATLNDCLGPELTAELVRWFSLTSPTQGRELESGGGFILLEEIGHGGMAQVFRARQKQPERIVAVKLLMPHLTGSEETRRRFLAEAEAMAELEHPGLLPLYAFGETDGRPWLVTRLAAGGNLAQRREAYSSQWNRIADLVAQLADAIQHAHSRGIIHRDLKPSNVLFDSEGGPCIADFGLAKWRDQVAGKEPTLSHAMMGTPAYMAPELAKHGAHCATTAADVYGLGAILYELLTGRPPHTGGSPSEILLSLSGSDPPQPRALRPGIPRDLEVIGLKAMAREPGQRYATAAALKDDVQRWLDGLPILARPYGPVDRLASWARRKPALAALSTLLVTSLVVGGGLLWRANQRLKTSLDDTEARVEFMTRELPASLKPLGRLDLLDSVFANVAEYYEEAPGREPAQLSRRADFMTEWSQILSPRGDTKGVIARLEQALALARQATAGARPADIASARARVLAGWRMGEALIKDAQLDRAEAVLNETLAFAAGQKTEDLAFRALVAQLTLESAFLQRERQEPDKSLAVAEASLKLWSVLQPQLEADGSPRSQEALVTAAQTQVVLAEIHRARDDQPANDAALRRALVEAEHLVKWKPENLQFSFHQSVVLLTAWQWMSDAAEEKLLWLEKADRLLLSLLAHDPSNVHWRLWATDAASCRFELAKNSGDEAAKTRWALEVEQRCLPLLRARITDLVHLRQLSDRAMFCGNYYFQRKDFSKTQEYWRFALRSLSHIARTTGSQEENATLKAKAARAAELLTSAIGAEASKAWLDDVENEPSP